MKTINIDVLIIGAGAAGIRAAIAASKEGASAIMVTEGPVTHFGSTFSEISKGWGIQALVGKERTNENLNAFYEDIIRVGLGQCDSRLVQILVEESGERVNDLMSYGIRFKHDPSGKYLRVNGCFSDLRWAFLTENFENIQHSFMSILQRLPVKIVTGFVLDLIVHEGACWGGWFISNDAEKIKINAKATILATGGGCGVFKDHMVSNNNVGDGYALADRAGAELVNLEFIQFMLGFKNNQSREFFSFGDPQEPAKLLDPIGVDILERCIPDSISRTKAMEERLNHGPFSCRDGSYFIDLAVALTRNQGKKVYASNRKGAEVVHFAHAFNGGVRINERAETTIPGLFAAGEVARGPYGADRIGGCMMSATQVFGERAGRFSAIRARKMQTKKIPEMVKSDMEQNTIQPITGTDDEIDSISQRVRKTMNKNAMILRQWDGLQECLGELDVCNHDLYEIRLKSPVPSKSWFKIRNMIITAKLITSAALKRNESLGSHYRNDFPISEAPSPS